VESTLHIPIKSEADIVVARKSARALAEELGFNGSDLTLIATAISEVARNIVQYADSGEIVIEPASQNGTVGICMIARDEGPGIPDLDKAMQDGYSTSNGLGLGLPGAKRLVDEFAVHTVVGSGTEVKMIKWEHSKDGTGWRARDSR
jgi:serine/threonine-protein kinase RsbT